MTTILQLSDTHLVATEGGPVYGADPDARLDATIDACNDSQYRIDMVIVTGDLTDDGSEAAYERLAKRLAGINAPVVALAGNHDDPALLSRHFDTGPTMHTGVWTMKIIDTARPEQIHGTLDPSDAAEALDGLADPTLIVMHHPPISPSTAKNFSLDNADALVDLIDATPKVRAVIAGHLHQPFQMILPGGVPVLGAPSTLVGAVHEGDTYHRGEGAVTGARLVRLHDDGTVSTDLLLTST